MTTATAIKTLAPMMTTLVGAHSLSPMTARADSALSITACPHCGLELSQYHDHDDPAAKAQQQIRELETQVRLLNSKAVATADKIADYEDEIRSLRAQAQASQSQTSQTYPPPRPTTATSEAVGRSPATPSNSTLTASPEPAQQTRLSSFAALLPYGRRRSTNNNTPANTAAAVTATANVLNNASTPQTLGGDNNRPGSSNNHSESTDLQTALTREQTLRKDAESRLTQATSELEDLTAQLFSQANEMVAQERKARAKLEERVEVLEHRDGEKRRRLERLEKAIQRVERVRGLVG